MRNNEEILKPYKQTTIEIIKKRPINETECVIENELRNTNSRIYYINKEIKNDSNNDDLKSSLELHKNIKAFLTAIKTIGIEYLKEEIEQEQ